MDREASKTSAAASLDAPPNRPHPRQTPIYHAHHADRYHRQELIEAYEARTGAKFVSAIDVIDIDFVLNLEEHLLHEQGDRELHLLLRSPGGDGEQAIRAIRVLQSRCSKLVLVVPDMAKSAATLLALGADEIRLAPASDLGPVDPQMQIGERWFPAKAILSAVTQAEEAVRNERSLTPLWASLLAEVTALDVQAAQAELQRTESMIRQALSYRTTPLDDEQTEKLVGALVAALQDEPTSHGASLGPTELRRLGLPVVPLDPNSWEWECVWRLWALYWVQIRGPIYESSSASFRPGGPHPA
jgi:ClpP class serine protease